MFKPFHLFLVILIGWACNLSAQPVNFESLRDQYLQPSDKWPKPFLDPGIAHNEIGLLPEITFPKSNSFSVAKMRLGETLFHDPILSSSKHIACASCHDRDLGWADGREVSFGHSRRFGKRNAPSIENAALWENLFWDGRASSLEQQALMPIQDSNEMNFSLFELALRLNINAYYKSKFNDVFGKDIVEVSDLAKALATFQRTIRSRNSDFDYFMHAIAEEDEEKKTFYAKQLSDQALWGMHLFRTKARCMNCHSGALFSDNEFHNIGLTYYKKEYEDLGLFNITGMPDDVGKFKTPSLRGVMNTKPWMHNGLFASMEGVINIYNAGGVRIPKDKNDVFFPETSSILKPLSLTAEEIKALEAFLNAITAQPARGSHFSFLSQ